MRRFPDIALASVRISLPEMGSSKSKIVVYLRDLRLKFSLRNKTDLPLTTKNKENQHREEPDYGVSQVFWI